MPQKVFPFKFLWFLGLFLFSTPFQAIQAQPLPDRAPLRGLVVDQNGQPIAGAIVSLRRQNAAGNFAFWSGEAAANEKGAFEFSDGEAGKYFLNAEAPGFAPLTSLNTDWKRDSPPLRITLLRFTQAILRLTRNGAPLSNSSVFVRLRSENGASQVQKQARTNAVGEVILDQLTPANYTIFVGAAEFSSTIPPREIGYEPTGVRLEIALEHGASLRAIVRDSQNIPIGGAIFGLQMAAPETANQPGGNFADPSEDFALLGVGGEHIMLSSRENDGSVEVRGVPPGRYIARFGRLGGEDSTQTVELRARETAEISFVHSQKGTATRATTLQLEFKNKTGQVLKNREVWLRLQRLRASDGAMNVQEENDLLALGEVSARRGQTDEQGRLKLYPVRPGRVRIIASSAKTHIDSKTPEESAPLDVVVAAEAQITTATLVLAE